jgi:uncharacterized protein YecE (DUF72 family)
VKNEKLLRVGTSSWSHEDWRGVVYPKEAKPGEFLSHYAQKFSTVEIDATWYRIPGEALVKKWERDTPKGFLFAAKIPSVITHEKMLEGCEGDLKEFLRAMDHLGEKLGPMVFQFPYAFKPDQIEKLEAFLKTLPKGYKFAVEVRHKGWLSQRFYDLLRSNGIAMVLLDLLWMPRLDVLTTDWAYVRFIGDRKGIEKNTKTWEKLVVDRSKEMAWWIPKIRGFMDRQVPTYAYFNNHYAGNAPLSIELFLQQWEQSA